MQEQQYFPVLFQTVAKQVMNGYPEQYLFEDKSGAITVMFSTDEIEGAITKASKQPRPEGLPIVGAEFMTSITQGSVRFSDVCDGLITVDNVVVTVSVKKMKEDEYRVLFTRVDAEKLYVETQQQLQDISTRLSKLESTLETAV